jgi:hypothetical protein
MESFGQALIAALSVWVPRIIGALLILAAGWLLARLLAAVTRKLLGWIKLDSRVSKGMEGAGENPVSLEGVITQTVYYLVIFMAVLAALNALGMVAITALFGTMLAQVFTYAPRVLYAVVLAAIAWVVARLLRAIVSRLLHGVGADKKVTEPAGMQPAPISTAIGEAVYWLVWLLFLPAILSVLGLVGILAPIQAMLTDLLTFLPNLLAAVVIVIVGLFVARILQRLITSALHALGADAISERVGLSQYLGKPNLSGLLGYFVYVVVFIPVVIAALNALGLTYLAQPLSDMLLQILAAIPKIVVAIAVLFIAYMVARVIADLVANLLSNAGFDKLAARFSLGQISETPAVSPSKLVGYVALVAIMLVATLAAVGLLGWNAMVVMLTAFIVFLARLLVGLIVLVVGAFLANLAGRIIMNTGLEQKRVLSLLARVAIIVFAVAMALDQVGVANDVVNMAFGLLLAGAALAAALAFGLGGTDVAKYQLVRWYRSAEANLATPPAPEATLADDNLVRMDKTVEAGLSTSPAPDASLPTLPVPAADLDEGALPA